MSIFIVIILTLFILVFSVLNNIYLGYGLSISLLFFSFVAIKKGFGIRKIFDIYWIEVKKSLNIILILILIGMLISSWLNSGTIPSIIYYCLKYINPNLFILSAFLMTSLISMLIGTSFGTISAIGIPLIIIGKASGIDLNILGGAIFSGAYLGDRTSPLSSSLLLVCNLCDIELFSYTKKLLLDNIPAFLICVVLYLILSLKFPLLSLDINLQNKLYSYFNISLLLLLPAIVLFVLSIFKVKITISIPISICFSIVLSLFVQHTDIYTLFHNLVFGYSASDKSLINIIHGGGIISMLKTCYIIIISCCISGFFSGLDVFDNFKSKLKQKNLSKSTLFLITVFVGVITAAIGCSQTIAIILTIDIVKDLHKNIDDNFNNQDFALDISNSAILTPALIPWCIAALVPCTILKIDSYGYIIYSFYLYIVPLVHFLKKYITSNNLYKEKIN